MKIQSIEVAPLVYQLKQPFTFAGVRLEQLDYAIVRVTTEAGVVGYGECPAYWEPRGETQASTLKAVAGISSFFSGMECATPEALGSALTQRIPRDYAAACGIDIALHDALGREERKPVFAYYGEAKPVPVEAAIPMVEESEASALVARALEQGIEVFKVKVGMDAERELRLLREIRKAIGPNRTLFVDANQGWKTLEAAQRALAAFAECTLAWVEQPMPASLPYDDFRKLQASSGVPIMLDESTYVVEDARAALDAGAATLFNIKLAKSRGLWGGHVLAREADARGASYMLGSMIEGALGTYAGVHFAATHAVRTTALNAFTFINDDKAFGPPVVHGYMHAPTTPGLGYDHAERFAACFAR